MLRPVAALALLASLLPTLASAREADPQQHEVRIDLDILVESKANQSVFDLQYTFTPSGLNRVDEVVPILRRFVRHPSSLWARVARSGAIYEEITGGRLGGDLQLLDGRLYLNGEGGIEYDNVSYDPVENGFWAAPFHLEVGARPLELISVGGFWEGRKVLGANEDQNITKERALRSGLEQRFGATVSAATPNDRVFATLAFWLARNDWTFEKFHPGDITVRGFGGSLRVAFQLSPSLSLQLRATVRREHWMNERIDDQTLVTGELDRNVVFANGAAEMYYWHRGRYGFRVGAGGGFWAAPPIVNSHETGIFQLSIGLITRF